MKLNRLSLTNHSRWRPVDGLLDLAGGDASRRRHVDLRQLSGEGGGDKYGFTPSQAWLDHVRASSLRIAGGCSASFISPQGLVMTNHHCVVDCVQALSTPQQNLVETGFIGPDRRRRAEVCRLRTRSTDPDPRRDVRRAASARGQDRRCRQRRPARQGGGAPAELRLRSRAYVAMWSRSTMAASTICTVTSATTTCAWCSHRSSRWRSSAAIPTTLTSRVSTSTSAFYAPTKAAIRRPRPDYFKWSANGSKDGDLVFVSGNPGGTSRELTISQLGFERDQVLSLHGWPRLAEYRGQLEQFIHEGPEQAREADEDLFFVANCIQGVPGDASRRWWIQNFSASSCRKSSAFARRSLPIRSSNADRSAWDDIAQIQGVRAQLFTRRAAMTNFFFSSGLIGHAITWCARQPSAPNPTANACPSTPIRRLFQVQQENSAPIPVYKDLEELNLTYLFTFVRRELGTDDPFVQKMLGKESPEQLAHRLVSGTHLNDPKVREGLYTGGQAAIAASTDPMIRFAASIDPDLRAVRKEYETRVDAPTRVAAERIAKARFAVIWHQRRS